MTHENSMLFPSDMPLHAVSTLLSVHAKRCLWLLAWIVSNAAHSRVHDWWHVIILVGCLQPQLPGSLQQDMGSPQYPGYSCLLLSQALIGLLQSPWSSLA